MRGVLKAFPAAARMILTDPVNFVLAVIPTLIALGIYIFTITGIYRHSDLLSAWLRGYVASPDQATWISKILTGILIIFVFFIMSWTFVLVVGIIAAPFNSLLSSRIEEKLVKRIIMDEDQTHALSLVKSSMAQTFKNEIKKFILLASFGAFAFLINLVPLLYPLAAILIAALLAAQFLDYSWSRHNLTAGNCIADAVKNFFSYSAGGAIFLAVVAVPVLNALVPALATSYFTILWLYKQKKIEL